MCFSYQHPIGAHCKWLCRHAPALPFNHHDNSKLCIQTEIHHLLIWPWYRPQNFWPFPAYYSLEGMPEGIHILDNFTPWTSEEHHWWRGQKGPNTAATSTMAARPPTTARTKATVSSTTSSVDATTLLLASQTRARELWLDTLTTLTLARQTPWTQQFHEPQQFREQQQQQTVTSKQCNHNNRMITSKQCNHNNRLTSKQECNPNDRQETPTETPLTTQQSPFEQ